MKQLMLHVYAVGHIRAGVIISNHTCVHPLNYVFVNKQIKTELNSNAVHV